MSNTGHSRPSSVVNGKVTRGGLQFCRELGIGEWSGKKCEREAYMKSLGGSHPALYKAFVGFACVFVQVSVG